MLTGVSLSLVANASARPFYGEQTYMDRATDGGAGHHPGDTNSN